MSAYAIDIFKHFIICSEHTDGEGDMQNKCSVHTVAIVVATFSIFIETTFGIFFEQNQREHIKEIQKIDK